MKLPRYSAWIGLAVVIAIALVIGFLPKARWVDVATVSTGPLQVTVEEEGKTRVIDRYVISAPVAGYARRIEPKVGDTIRQGQVLLDLDPLRPHVLDARSRAEAKAREAAARAALQVAKQNARAARADAELAQIDYLRIKDLRKSFQVSEEQEDQAAAKARASKASQRSAEFGVEVARHELEAARTALSYSAAKQGEKPAEHVDITAPINGSVLKVYRDSEGVVAAGQPLIEVGNPKALEVEVDVLSADAIKVKPGMRVVVERWGGEQTLEGRVRLIEPVGFTKVSALGVEEQRVLVITDITSDPKQWQRLGDGYRVEAKFILWEADNVLRIPVSALFHYQDGWAVFVLDNGRAQRRVIQVGQRNGLTAQVFDGLAEDETVIIYPDDSIDDGRRVKRRSYD